MPLKITEDMRSMIASAFANAITETSETPYTREEHERCKDISLCCAPDNQAACRAIVGARYAEALREFAYEGLACGRCADEQWYLDKIAELEVLYTYAEKRRMWHQ